VEGKRNGIGASNCFSCVNKFKKRLDKRIKGDILENQRSFSFMRLRYWFSEVVDESKQ
jgi:hypothetical protein